MTSGDRLRDWARCLVDPAAPPHALQSTCDAFHRWALEESRALSSASTTLPCGLAISPADAATCTLDAPRTAAFVRAIDAAVVARRASRRSDSIELLYAGCGPLAPLALLATALHQDATLHLTLVDVHADALESARGLFNRAGFENVLRDPICADAATLTLPSALPPPDILVVEVMQAALAREPQLAVVANLVPQCAAGVDLVPARVAVELAVGPLAEWFAGGAEVASLALLIDLRASTAATLWGSRREHALPPIEIDIPPQAAHGSHLALLTTIDAGHGHPVPDRASGLTQPVVLAALGRVEPGDIVRLRYRLGTDPGFEATRVDEPHA